MEKLSTLLLMVVMVLTMSLSVQAAAVKMNKAKATLYPGQKVTLKVTGTSKKAKWSSSNAKVAKVSKGKVTAVKKGKATIKAKVGKKTYTCKITVKAPALSQKKLNVTVGSKATVKPNGTKIKSVSSSNKKVATVTKKGVITGKKTGKCTVTFKGANGKSYKCTVTVGANNCNPGTNHNSSANCDPGTNRNPGANCNPSTDRNPGTNRDSSADCNTSTNCNSNPYSNYPAGGFHSG